MLREHGVVGKFVEFYGEALADMQLATRATLANMAPEYGATMGFFPVDEQTTKYMHLTGRDEKLIETVEQYCKLQGLWRDDSRKITYTSSVELDLSTVEPSMAGPKRPQDRITLSDMKSQWQENRAEMFGHPTPAKSSVTCDGETFDLVDGDVVVAAITSCTNTSNPSVMVAAGLVAKKANALGLKRKPWVKTSLAPGSKVVTEYLVRANLLGDLEALGFYVVGYGCTTCIGNSGPLQKPISDAINEDDLVACSVLSGNRNFEGRIGPDIKANYLASPPLVVAYAIAGTVDIDITSEPLATIDGTDIFLKDIWPTDEEVQEAIQHCLGRAQFVEQYSDVFGGSEDWKNIQAGEGQLFNWSDESTYIHEPPFFQDMTTTVPGIHAIAGARVLCKLGDSVTTDHISPAGNIGSASPAGKFLQDQGVPISMFNSFGSRRGNDLVMTRGTFGNVRVKNHLAPGTEGGFTTDFTTGEVRSIYDASCNYKEAGIPLVVLAGKDYGMGSSRDWAAKGTMLLGVKAVIATSYERIHRSNLVGMGVLPLEHLHGESAESLGLDGSESFAVAIDESVQPRNEITVTATKGDGSEVVFQTMCRIDTPVEVEYYRNGGILHTVLRKMAAE
jgi:aconitate hydratase